MNDLGTWLNDDLSACEEEIGRKAVFRDTVVNVIIDDDGDGAALSLAGTKEEEQIIFVSRLEQFGDRLPRARDVIQFPAKGSEFFGEVPKTYRINNVKTEHTGAVIEMECSVLGRDK